MPNQLEALTSDINECYEWAVDVLDQMEEALNLKLTGTFDTYQLVKHLLNILRLQ